MKRFLIINGPNLNLLGRRQPEIYGSRTFEDYLQHLRGALPEVQIDYYQSNCEGALVTRIQQAHFDEGYDGIVINPGAYAHYSIAIADAIEAIEIPVVEVHISNIHAREEFRHHSVVSRVCRGVICGLGLNGYEAALRNLLA